MDTLSLKNFVNGLDLNDIGLRVGASLVVSGVLAFALSTLQKAKALTGQIDPKLGDRLRVHSLYRTTSISCIVVSLTALVGACFLHHDANSLFALSALFALPGLPLWVYYLNHRVFLDGTGITVTNFWGNAQSLRWSDVQGASFSQRTHYLRIEDRDGENVNIHDSIAGYNIILEFLATYTNVSLNN